MAAILLIFKATKGQHGQHFLKIVTTEEGVAITCQEHRVVLRRNGCSSVVPTQPAQNPTQLRTAKPHGAGDSSRALGEDCFLMKVCLWH